MLYLDNPLPYTTHTIELQIGDSIYIFSDGYVDQFGGEKGKKYKTVNFKQRLLEFTQQPIMDQSALLDREFESWKGDLEQIDDVCVIGLKIS
jgi:serine phosphatase RsbU (regulator of sigma subunit)